MEKWPIIKNQIEKEFEFKNFVEAVDFINKISGLAEEANHHPDLFLHSYNKIRVSLMTHSKGKITEKDYQLASRIDQL